MAYLPAFLLLLSFASTSVALPVAQAGARDTNVTFDDGSYRWTETKPQGSPPVVLPETTTPVFTSGPPQQTETSTSIILSTSTVVDVPQSTGDVPVTSVTYKRFSGDGSEAAGWPSSTKWVSFDQM